MKIHAKCKCNVNGDNKRTCVTFVSTSYHSESKFSLCRPRCDCGNSLLFKAQTPGCPTIRHHYTQSLFVNIRYQKSHVSAFFHERNFEPAGEPVIDVIIFVWIGLHYSKLLGYRGKMQTNQIKELTWLLFSREKLIKIPNRRLVTSVIFRGSMCNIRRNRNH